MSRRRSLLAALAVPALLVPAAAGAQVGYPPAASPFRDLEYRQQLGVEAGWFLAQRDPAGVAPRSGPLTGVRWAMQFSNPFIITARLATAFTERDVIDPAATPENRFYRTEDVQLTLFDVAMGLSFTGYRSWHNLVPEATAGAGFVSAFDDSDLGGFQFGTPFALNGSAGVRWVPGGRWSLRADLTHRMYRVSYPQSYYQTTGGEAVLGAQESNSRWTHNPAITIGVSYLFDR